MNCDVSGQTCQTDSPNRQVYGHMSGTSQMPLAMLPQAESVALRGHDFCPDSLLGKKICAHCFLAFRHSCAFPRAKLIFIFFLKRERPPETSLLAYLRLYPQAQTSKQTAKSTQLHRGHRATGFSTMALSRLLPVAINPHHGVDQCLFIEKHRPTKTRHF